MSNSFSIDERVQLLCRTITAEVFKRLQISLFVDDRQLAMYMIASRVQEAENFLEPKLFDFVLKGSKTISATATVPVSLHGYAVPGMTNMAWADLQYLATLKPFNATNLLDHIVKHPTQWKDFCAAEVDRLTYGNLPNAEVLDLRFFTMMDQAEFDDVAVPGPAGTTAPAILAEHTAPVSVQGDAEMDDADIKSHGRGAQSATGARTQNTDSRGGPRSLKRTESDILADPDIWDVGASSDSDEDGAAAKGVDDEPGDILDLLQESDLGTQVDSADVDMQEMAKYLIDSAPGNPNAAQRDYIDALRKKTSTERELILRRERALKSLCELAVLKCLRPDLLVSALDNFASGVVDVNYFDFEMDIERPI